MVTNKFANDICLIFLWYVNERIFKWATQQLIIGDLSLYNQKKLPLNFISIQFALNLRNINYLKVIFMEEVEGAKV